MSKNQTAQVKHKGNKSGSKESLQKRVQQDKYPKETSQRLIERSVNCIQVSEFLFDHLFTQITEDDCSEDCISLEGKSYIDCLLRMTKDIAKQAHEITKENRKLEIELFEKKMELKDKIKKRNESWNKAIKVYNNIYPKPRTLEGIHELCNESEHDDSNPMEGSSEDVKIKRIKDKYELIQELAGVLFKLITFSGTRWATQINLLQIVLCTGKIVNYKFNVSNLKELEKFVFNCIYRLNRVKL